LWYLKYSRAQPAKEKAWGHPNLNETKEKWGGHIPVKKKRKDSAENEKKTNEKNGNFAVGGKK